jgi:hypothetical protein
MKANAPEKIYVDSKAVGDDISTTVHTKRQDYPTCTEYTRTDAFIEKALKWYCLDCECNDNCKDTKCFFHNAYKRYLEGDTNSLPPKFSNTILNEDGSTSDNWRYRHFISKMQDAFIEKACEWLDETLRNTDFYENEIELMVNEFKKAMML